MKDKEEKDKELHPEKPIQAPDKPEESGGGKPDVETQDEGDKPPTPPPTPPKP